MDYIKATEKILWQYTSYKAYIENAKEELAEMDKDAGVGMGIDYSKDKLAPTYKFSSMTESEAEQRIDRKELLQKQIEIISHKLNRIERALNALSETDRKIIEMYYFQGKRIWEIQFEVQYSDRQVKRKKRYALEKLKISIYGENIRNMAL